MLRSIKDKAKHTIDAVCNGSPAARNSKVADECEDALSQLIGRLKAMPDAFQPLLDAVAGLLTTVQRFKTLVNTHPERYRLMQDMSDVLVALNGYLDQSVVWSPSIARLALGITHETRTLAERPKGEGRKTRKPTKTEQDESLKCHRLIQLQLARFLLTENTEMWSQFHPKPPRYDNMDQSVATESEWILQETITQLPYCGTSEYNSPESQCIGRTGCAPGTRTQALHRLQSSIHHCSGRPITWITGSAGTGKTALAYSLCEYLNEAGLLAASFFFSDRLRYSSERHMASSLASQLSQYCRPFHSMVSHMIERCPSIVNLPVTVQMMKLVVFPLSKVGHTFPIGATIVIDGLDECGNCESIVQMLSELIRRFPHLSLRLVLTSRPAAIPAGHKADIEDWGTSLDALDAVPLTSDIEVYLRSQMKRLRLLRSDLLSDPWKGPNVFAYVATLMCYIEGGASEGAQKDLRYARDTFEEKKTPDQSDSLGLLYSLIIQDTLGVDGIAGDTQTAALNALHVLVCLKEPVTWGLLAYLTGFELSPTSQGSLSRLLRSLYGRQTDTGYLAVGQLFAGYVGHAVQSGVFRCDTAFTNSQTAQRCFDLINSQAVLFNVHNMQSPFTSEKQISNPDVRVHSAITSELAYASRHWAAHLCTAHITKNLLLGLHNFLSTRLLLWLEVMSLIGQPREVADAIKSIEGWQHVRTIPEETRLLLDDAIGFAKVFLFGEALHWTPQLYLSVLGCWPLDSPVSRMYRHQFVSLPKLKSISLAQTDKRQMLQPHYTTRSQAQAQATGIVQQTFRGHPDCVECVAYSPNGAAIASGSDYYTICIRDTHTGMLVGEPLTGHKKRILSVAYSPDSAYLVSGSADKTVRIWDAHTGQQVGQPLTGHTSNVNSVAYSLDGAYIASGSEDKTIRIWDAKTGKQVGKPLTGHISYVMSVVYSPDGAYIASGSGDESIRIWDAHTGQQIGVPLTGHTDLVFSVAYSPNGAHIASGSRDNTVRIWDAHTGQQVGQTLTGHTNNVKAVAYSPDGAYIVSGSYDRTIRIWDAKTGKQVGQPLTGHTRSVLSVAFSPDGAYLASGSGDESVRIWDVQHHINQTIPIEILTDDASPEGYTIDRNGWVLDNQQNRLVCIPPSLQRQYRWRCAEDEILQLDLRGVKLGEGWHECYKPQSAHEGIISEIDA